MDEPMAAQLQQLRGMETDLLRRRYREVFREEPPAVNKDYLRRRIAWQMQSLVEGDISEAARRRALEIAHDVELNGRVLFERTAHKRKRARMDRRVPKPGTEITRVYGSRTIVVKVLKDGFECEGQHYSSLSAAAGAVTGTRWNGLVFFGLAKRGETAKRKRRRPAGQKRRASSRSREASHAA